MEKDTISPEEMQDRLDLIEHKLKFVQQKPLVAVVVDFGPLKTDNKELAGAIEKAGAEMATDISLAEIILIYQKGLAMSSLMANVSIAVHQQDMQKILAVKNNRVYLLDPEKIVEKGNLELIESLAEIIQPKQFVFGYEGDLWVQFAV